MLSAARRNGIAQTLYLDQAMSQPVTLPVTTSSVVAYWCEHGALALTITFSGVSVATPGLYSVRLTSAAKNASSSSYRARISSAILSRTA